MVARDYHKTKGLAKAVVGEIDTSAPFQSVKDAVSLFGEGAFSGERPAIRKAKPQSAESVVAKEMQLHLAQKELNKLEEQLKNAETTKAQAVVELDRAKRTVEDLTQKLKSIYDSRDSAISATEMAKHQAKKFAEADESTYKDLETARVEYAASATKLDAAKQELRKIRREYDAFMEAKDTAAKQAAEAENATKSNLERFGELSEEIAIVQESIQQVKLASTRADEEEMMICAEKDKQKQLYKTRLDELFEKLTAFKKDTDPELIKNLETQLSETLSEVEALRKKMENRRANDLDSVKTVTSELDGAKETLQEIAEEENPLRNLVVTLKVELNNVKNEHSELKESEAETESVAGNLHVKIRKAKSDLEEALTEEAKATGASDEMIATIHQLALESQKAQLEAEKMKQQAEELKSEAEATRIELEEAEKRLRIVIHEAEEAKAAEVRALDQIQILSEKNDAARASTSEPGAQITISRDEYESLSRKAEESEKLAEMKVAAAMAQVEAVKANENEALKRLEAMWKEIEDMKSAKQEALKKAEMADAARRAVEGELRRWREREEKKAVEAAARVVAETEKSFESSPLYYRVEKQKPQERVIEPRKLEKARTSVAKKVIMPNLSGVFHKKKRQVEGSSTCSRGEKLAW